MSMRTHRLTTYLQAEEAYTLIEFLDRVRDMLLEGVPSFSVQYVTRAVHLVGWVIANFVFALTRIQPDDCGLRPLGDCHGV